MKLAIRTRGVSRFFIGGNVMVFSSSVIANTLANVPFGSQSYRLFVVIVFEIEPVVDLARTPRSILSGIVFKRETIHDNGVRLNASFVANDCDPLAPLFGFVVATLFR
jgi:hypothetical protein